MGLLPIDEVIEGVKGGKLEFEIALVDENGRPVDTTVYDAFKVCVKLTASTALEISQVANGNGSVMTKVGAPEIGVFKVQINPVDTAGLLVAERQDIDFEMKETADATNIIRTVFKDRLSVFKTSCT